MALCTAKMNALFSQQKFGQTCEQINKTKKTLPFVLLETSCVNNMCHNQCLFYDDVFRLKGGWVGIPPFFRAALPTLNHCVHPPKRWVFKRVLRKQMTGKHDPKQKPSLQIPVTQKHVLSMPGLKPSTLQTLPRLCNQEETATKKSATEVTLIICDCWCQHFCRPCFASCLSFGVSAI